MHLPLPCPVCGRHRLLPRPPDLALTPSPVSFAPAAITTATCEVTLSTFPTTSMSTCPTGYPTLRPPPALRWPIPPAPLLPLPRLLTLQLVTVDQWVEIMDEEMGIDVDWRAIQPVLGGSVGRVDPKTQQIIPSGYRQALSPATPICVLSAGRLCLNGTATGSFVPAAVLHQDVVIPGHPAAGGRPPTVVPRTIAASFRPMPTQRGLSCEVEPCGHAQRWRACAVPDGLLRHVPMSKPSLRRPGPGIQRERYRSVCTGAPPHWAGHVPTHPPSVGSEQGKAHPERAPSLH